MAQVFKNPIEQANEIISPFNTRKVSHDLPLNKEFKNRRLIKISPNDYYKLVSDQWKIPVDEIIDDRMKNYNKLSIDDMRKMMREGVKFDTPYIKLKDSGVGDANFQEGLHRMLAAGLEFGMDTKFPVYLGYQTNPWIDIDRIPMDEFLKVYKNK